jgi:hypothetical protein
MMERPALLGYFRLLFRHLAENFRDSNPLAQLF